MTTKAKSAPPPVAKTLDEQKADFTSEGSPPPGVVGKPMPTPARKTHFKNPKIWPDLPTIPMRIANVLIAASLATMLASPVLAKLPAPTDAEKAAAAEAAANLVRVDIRLRKETPVMTDTRASL